MTLSIGMISENETNPVLSLCAIKNNDHISLGQCTSRSHIYTIKYIK